MSSFASLTARVGAGLLPFVVGTLGAVPVSAQTLTTDTIATGLTRPVWAGALPGDERIFYAEQHTGAVKILDGSGAPLGTFLDVGTVATGNEQGLLGVAFHPKYEQNGYVFMNYTRSNGDTVIERWTVSAADPNVADPTTRTLFFLLDQPFSNHNAGGMAFSPVDGYLYVALGDGGSGNDPACRAQNPQAFLGKMLRLDVDAPDPVAGTAYSIPADNPFVGDAGVLDEIWAFGLRNPFRFAFDAQNGDLYIGDVGQNNREEIDYEPALTAGRNYGWPVMEGELCNSPGVNNCSSIAPPGCFDAAYTGPVHTYETGGGGFEPGDGRAIIGGQVYRGCSTPNLQGTYFFADNDSGRYWSLEIVGGVATNFAERTSELSSAGGRPAAFGVDGNGEILVVNLSGGGGGGRISRIVPASTPSIADCDGNGQDDNCEIVNKGWADMDGSGVLDACESFSVDTDHICITTGGRQQWNLHAGSALGGSGYLVLGSLAGTTPGIPFGGINLPLNADAYFVLSAQLANSVPFDGSFGALDGAGNAQAAFDAPAGLLPASVVGLTANHAYVTIDGSLSVTFASNYTGLEFRP